MALTGAAVQAEGMLSEENSAASSVSDVSIAADTPAATDIQVWQGQYYKGTEFQVGRDGKRFVLQDNKGSINISGNITTTETGFFGRLGSLTSRITTSWVRDINFNGTITGTGNIITSQNITSNYATAITGLFTSLNTTNITAVQYNSVDAGESKTGLTSSQFRVCKKFKVPDNACEEWCMLEITGGIITNCK